MLATRRSSPPRPTSAHTTTSPGRGSPTTTTRRRCATARSAAGSVTRAPPTAIVKASSPTSGSSARRSSTARTMPTRPRVEPVHRPARLGRVGGRRRAPAPRPARDGDPPSPAARPTPPRPARRSARNMTDGSGTTSSPPSAIAISPSSPVAPNRCLVARSVRSGEVAFALEREDGVDDVLEHAGAGERALLGDVTDDHDGLVGPLGEAHELVRAVTDLRRPSPGAELRSGSCSDWIESTTATAASTCTRWREHRAAASSRWPGRARGASAPRRSARLRT